MKNYKNMSKALLSIIGIIGLLSFSSCLKNNDSQYYSPPAALLTFIQASPDQPPLDFSLDNNHINYWPLAFGDNIDYFRAFTGKRNANFYNHGTGNVILSDTIHLTQNNTYSLFLVNTPAHPQILLLTDSLIKPPTGSAGIRFVNLSPDAPAVDLAITGGAVLVANKGFKGYSSFANIGGNASYSLEVRQAGTTTVLATLPNVTLNNGFVYTIWLRGLAASTNNTDQLGISVLANAIFY
ncbi:MAG: hypothetical protein JWP94_1081 [Mucilaginibacter sp.]|nr:hypothetical protein [Mucilaginibacter sp.]